MFVSPGPQDCGDSFAHRNVDTDVFGVANDRGVECVEFDEAATRDAEMHSEIDEWIDDLVGAVNEARASEEFQEWLDVQQRFHDYSYRSSLLIKRQCPEATKVAGYRT